MKRLTLVIIGWISITHLSLAGNSTPSADEQHAVFVGVNKEMPQFAKYFRLVGGRYEADMAAYIFTCEPIDPGKAEWFVFVPIELANNVDAVSALFNQATVDYTFWKEEIADESARR